jgi:predicted transposase YbfD/YdcC
MDQQQYTTLVDVFSHLPDPRKRKGRQHRWLTLLCLIAAALASAYRTPRAIARWVHSHREELFAVLPASVSRLPSEATIRRALALLDVAVLEQALTAFHPPAPEAPDTAASPPDALQGVAIDGKAIRGVGRDGHPCHLVSLVQHADARVLGQVAVALKRDERSAVPELLAGRDLSGKVVTLDALHTLRPTARQIRAVGGHYLMIVKKNQAALYEYLDMLFTRPAHPADHEVWDTFGPMREKGHGRLETRRLTCGNAHSEDGDWPDVQQVVRRECERIVLKTGKRSCEVTYAMVSMMPAEAGAATIERLWRGHWTIENQTHYVRDVTFGEDAGHAAQGNTAQVLAALRNGLLTLFRRAHWRSIPDALAHYGASVARAFALIGLEVKT